jgi:hypothetical protein
MGLGQGSDPWREIGKLARKQRQFEAPSGFGCTPELLQAHLTYDFPGILKPVMVDGDARDERAVWRAGLRLHKRMHPKVAQAALAIEPADHGRIRILSGGHSDMNEQPGKKSRRKTASSRCAFALVLLVCFEFMIGDFQIRFGFWFSNFTFLF